MDDFSNGSQGQNDALEEFEQVDEFQEEVDAEYCWLCGLDEDTLRREQQKNDNDWANFSHENFVRIAAHDRFREQGNIFASGKHPAPSLSPSISDNHPEPSLSCSTHTNSESAMDAAVLRTDLDRVGDLSGLIGTAFCSALLLWAGGRPMRAALVWFLWNAPWNKLVVHWWIFGAAVSGVYVGFQTAFARREKYEPPISLRSRVGVGLFVAGLAFGQIVGVGVAILFVLLGGGGSEDGGPWEFNTYRD